MGSVYVHTRQMFSISIYLNLWKVAKFANPVVFKNIEIQNLNESRYKFNLYVLQIIFFNYR